MSRFTNLFQETAPEVAPVPQVAPQPDKVEKVFDEKPVKVVKKKKSS
jgi:hypothetical protein